MSNSLYSLLDSIFYPDLRNLYFERNENIINLWIIIEEKTFEHTKKYIRRIREESFKHDINVEYLIFDKIDKNKIIYQLDMEQRNYFEYLH